MSEPTGVFSEVGEHLTLGDALIRLREQGAIDYGAARRTFDELYYGNPIELGLVLSRVIDAALGGEKG